MMMRSSNFATQLVRETGQKEAVESRGVPTSCIRLINEGVQEKLKECKDQERLKM